MSDGVIKVWYGVWKVSYGGKEVIDGVRKMSHGDRKDSDLIMNFPVGDRKVSDNDRKDQEGVRLGQEGVRKGSVQWWENIKNYLDTLGFPTVDPMNSIIYMVAKEIHK